MALSNLLMSSVRAHIKLVALQKRTRRVERQTRKPGVEPVYVTVPKIAEKIRPHVSFREEFLVAPGTWCPRCEERLVHFGVVEAGHWPAVEAERPRSEHQVCTL